MILKRTKNFVMLLSASLDTLGRMSLIILNDLIAVVMEVTKRIIKSLYVIGIMLFMIVVVIVEMISRLWNVIVHGEYNIELDRGGIFGKNRSSSNESSRSDD